MPEARSVSTATGSEAYLAPLVLAGADQASATLKVAPLDKAGVLTVYDLPAGNTVLTLAMTLYDILRASNPSSTTLEVQSEASMGYTRVTGKDLSFNVERVGLGAFAVNFTGGTLVANNGIDTANPAQYDQIVNFHTVGSANNWVCG